MLEDKIDEKVTAPRGYSWKFYIGFTLAVLNIPLGWLGVWLFFFPLDHSWLSILGLFIYLLSWLVLALGLWWVGKEYAAKVHRYINYKFYHESMKRGTAKMYHLTREKTKQFRENAQVKTQEFRDKARNHTNQVREKVRVHLVKVKVKSPFKKKV